MFFSFLVVLWMTYGVAGSTAGPFVPLRFIQEPTDTVARKNEPVTLKCSVQGSPSPTKITWEKNGQQINADSRRRIGSNGALLISKIIHKREYKPDVGEYQCFASSTVGRIASRKVRLEVAGISKKFLYEPQNSVSWVGSIAQFYCQVRHAVPAATITWEKDGTPLSSSHRVEILEKGILQIMNINKADEGNYSCVAQNVAKTRHSRTASLTVQAGSTLNKTRLKFLTIPHNATVLKGGTTVLECAAVGYLLPTIRWKKLDGNPRIFSASNSAFGINNLKLININESDGGEYKCQASSNGQTIYRSVWLFVRVSPQFTAKPQSVEVTTDGPTVLKCAVTGLPLPLLSWFKNGNELISNGQTTTITHYSGGTDLTISSLSASDGGIYQCFAKNEVGSIQTSANVIVHRSDNQPGPPTNVLAFPHSTSSILISWSPPLGNHSIVAYTVHYKKIGDNEKQKVVGQDTHSCIITGLQGFTNYSLYVRAITKKIGRRSKEIVQKTPQGSPSRPPENVTVTSVTPDSLDVEWQPPPKDYRNGIITRYVISYEKQGERGLPSTLEVPGQILRKTINGLSKGKTYNIKVCAATVADKGPWSLPVTAAVLLQSTNVISAPTLWIERNSTFANVKWLPPKYGEESVKEYHLYYVQLQSSKPGLGPFIIGKQHQSYLLKGLSPGSEYLVKLMAWDGERLGQPGANYVTRSKDSSVPQHHRPPPSRPINMVCTVESATSILLTWDRPLSAERIAYYTVKYHLRRSLNPEPVEARVSTESIIINGLSSGKDYTIFIRSHYATTTKEYPSELSTTQTHCSIPLRAPSSPPRNVKFEYKSITSVEIIWNKPTETNGELTSYDIFYTYNSSWPDSNWMVETKHLGIVGSYAKKLYTRLTGIKENTTFFLKIRAENKDGYGPFCDIVRIRPPTSVPRVSPNVTYAILSSRLVQLSWECPRIFNTFIKSFTIRFTNNINLPEENWNMQTVVLGSSERFADVVQTTIAIEQAKIYYIKLRAEYGDQIPGKWSNVVKVFPPGAGENRSTQSPRISELEENPEFNIKLGVIIGCTISALCVVVLVLFLVWRNPCRQVPINQGKEKVPVNGLPSLNELLPHHQQIVAAEKVDNSASTEETSASSGICRCRCTCGAASQWPLGPKMVSTNSKLPGSSDSSTPITRVFENPRSREASQESLRHQDIRNKTDECNPGSSNSISVELYRDERITTIPVSSRSYKQSISVDV